MYSCSREMHHGKCRRRYKKIRTQRYKSQNGSCIQQSGTAFFIQMAIVVFDCIQRISSQQTYNNCPRSCSCICFFIRSPVDIAASYVCTRAFFHLLLCLFVRLLVFFFSMSNLFQLKFTRTENANQQVYVAYLTPRECKSGWVCTVWIKSALAKKNERKKIPSEHIDKPHNLNVVQRRSESW